MTNSHALQGTISNECHFSCVNGSSRRHSGEFRLYQSSSGQHRGVIGTVEHVKNCADNATVPQLSTLRLEGVFLNAGPRTGGAAVGP
jgi:hypothetical protein